MQPNQFAVDADRRRAGRQAQHGPQSGRVVFANQALDDQRDVLIDLAGVAEDQRRNFRLTEGLSGGRVREGFARGGGSDIDGHVLKGMSYNVGQQRVPACGCASVRYGMLTRQTVRGDRVGMSRVSPAAMPGVRLSVHAVQIRFPSLIRHRLSERIQWQAAMRSEVYVSTDGSPRILAIHAHPDDVEFQCAGTLALLAQQGCAITIATMTPGDCGSAEHSAEEIAEIRRGEARASAATSGGRIRLPRISRPVDCRR